MKSLLGMVRRSDVVFRTNGCFDIKSRAVRALDISPGDVVDVLSDGNEYFLYVACRPKNISCGRFEAQVFPSNNRKGGRHFRGFSARLCQAMLAVSNAVGKAAIPCGEVIIDEHGRHLLPIIVRLNLTTQ